MIVCHCHAVSDREIKRAVKGGARSIEAVGHACGAGTACMGCQCTISKVIRKTENAECRASLAVAAAQLAPGLA